MRARRPWSPAFTTRSCTTASVAQHRVQLFLHMQARAARAHHHGRRACSRARPRRARNPSARAPARHHCIHCPLLRGDPWKQMARLRAVNWPAFARCILPLNSAPARGLQLGSPNGILEALRRVACNSDLLTAIIMEPITAPSLRCEILESVSGSRRTARSQGSLADDPGETVG